MRKPRRSNSNQRSLIVPGIVKLWILRLLVKCGGHREFITNDGILNLAIAEAIGLIDSPYSNEQEFGLKEAMNKLKQLHQEAEIQYKNSKVPDLLSKNINRLNEILSLSVTESRIVEFCVLLHNETLLDQASECLGAFNSNRTSQVLSIVLDLPERDIRESLSPQSLLCKSGLVSIFKGNSSLSYKLESLSDSFKDAMISSDTDPLSLLKDSVILANHPELTLQDFKHIEPTLKILIPYLKYAYETGKKGVNIFLHGNPGTGKSQLARVIAKEISSELFEVSSEDSRGDPVFKDNRLRAYKAAQRFLEKRKAIILFDEVEDVFNDGDLFGSNTTAKRCKAWMNKALEENSLPTIWLSNSIRDLDPAFIRRFDFVFELKVPPKQLRKVIIQKNCADILDAISISNIAESDCLAPAVITRAASVVRSISSALGEDGSKDAIRLLIDNTLEAQGHCPINKHKNKLPDIYDPSYINADADLSHLAHGLAATKSGRICLFGAPGTGKTAYGHWLSEYMDTPLIIKRASDLMSKWLGDTEKNIARSFKEATDENSILLIDEVDSFLQDRRNASHGWESSLVNEMLTQMESFDGIFIASTNLMEGLDQASLRRFDLKVKFDYLNAEQALRLFHRYISHLGLELPSPNGLVRIKRLNNLTPGDFAVIGRQNKFRPIQSTDGLIAALEAECALKENMKSAIGFV